MSANNEHRKHARLARAALGEWGRTELALLGASCETIRTFCESLSHALSSKWKVAIVDADHQGEANDVVPSSFNFTNKIRFTRIETVQALTQLQKHALFNDYDAILLNGNHFRAERQIVFVDPGKSLESKLDQLTDVRLVLLKDRSAVIPSYLRPCTAAAPVIAVDDEKSILAFFDEFLSLQVAPLNGLVLTGGKSLRMGTDKGGLNYHGVAQREHVARLLRPLCNEVFLSCAPGQDVEGHHARIDDRFLGIGPMGGILSALQQAPESAWLTVACDLPFLTSETLSFLANKRNPSRLATAFISPEEGFPEPLVTIWEPRAYPVLMQALSEGHSCPRKVLMASDTELLRAPEPGELQNVNDPKAFAKALSELTVLHLNDKA